MGTAAGCREDQELGCSFIFPPYGVQACQEYNKNEREKEGEETSHWIFHEWFLSEEKEHLCLWRLRGGEAAKAGCHRLPLGTQGSVQRPVPGVKSNLCCNILRLQLKRTLPLPSVLSACSCLLCTSGAAVIPRGFGSEVQWVWMLSTLKTKPFLPLTGENPWQPHWFMCPRRAVGWPGRSMSLSTWDWPSPEAMHGCLQNPWGSLLSYFSSSFLAGVASPPSEAPGADNSCKGEAEKDRGIDPHGDVKHCPGSPAQDYIWPHIWDQQSASLSSDWQELWGSFLLFEVRALSLSVQSRGNFISQFLSCVVIKDVLEDSSTNSTALSLWL